MKQISFQENTVAKIDPFRETKLKHINFFKVIKELFHKRAVGPDGFTVEFCQTSIDKIVQIVHKLFHSMENEGETLLSFYEASIILIPKPYNDSIKNHKLNHFYEYWCKNTK